MPVACLCNFGAAFPLLIKTGGGCFGTFGAAAALVGLAAMRGVSDSTAASASSSARALSNSRKISFSSSSSIFEVDAAGDGDSIARYQSN